MTSQRHRLALAVGLALAWYVVVLLVLYGVGALVREKRDIDWLAHALLFPLSLLSRLEIALTETLGTVRGGEKQLGEPLKKLLMVAIPVLHFAFVTLVAYVLVTWRARRVVNPSARERA